MAFKSEFIAERLGDYWRRFKEIDALKGYWDGLLELTSNISLNMDEVNKGKGLFTIQTFQHSSPVLFVFDSTTAVTPPPGYAAAFKIDTEIIRIPALASNSDGSGTLLFDGISYTVTSPGVLAFSALPPRLMFAADVVCDRKSVYRNFGYPIDFKQDTSDLYKARVQGLWYSLWNGGAVSNIKLGFHILFNLPFVQKGRVTAIVTNGDGSKTVTISGVDYIIPPYLEPTVIVGDVITNFRAISTGTKLYDFINNPLFFTIIDLPKVQKYFTFLPIIQADVIIAEELATGNPFDFSVVHQFLQKIKPAYTDYIIGIELILRDPMEVFTEPTLLEEYLRLTLTMDINYMNYLILPTYAAVNGIPGGTLDLQVAAIKDDPNYNLDGEDVGFKETLSIYDEPLLELTSTVGNGPLVQNSPAAGDDPVNLFSIGAAFETLNGVTLATYNSHLTDFPQFDLDLETVALGDSLQVKDLVSSTVLVTV